jgi:hypothetical protein
MPLTLDLNLTPIVREAGQDLASTAGLVVVEPPRWPARGRNEDRLILYFGTLANVSLPPARLEQALAAAGKTFYTTAGSATAALKAAAQAMNEALLERNKRPENAARPALGALAQVVLRQDQLYVARSGPVSGWHISAEGAAPLNEGALGTGQPLGLVKAVPILYFQTALQSNDTLALALKAPESWTEQMLAGVHGQGPEGMRRRLAGREALDLHALLIQARPGQGKIYLPHPATGSAPSGAAILTQAGFAQPGGRDSTPAAVIAQAPSSSLPRTLPTLEELEADSVARATAVTASLAAAEAAARAALTPLPAPVQTPSVTEPEPQPDAPVEVQGLPELPSAGADDNSAGASAGAAPVAATSEPLITAQPEPAGTLIRPGLARPVPPPTPAPLSPPASQPAAAAPAPAPVLAAAPASVPAAPRKGFLAGVSAVLGGLGRALGRILPPDPFASIPDATMILISVAVPVIIVSAASVVYMQRGLLAQSQAAMTQAQTAAQTARSQKDPATRRAAWEKTLQILDQAKADGVIPAAASLRLEAQKEIDELNFIRRPAYQPAILGGLQPTARVTRILVIENDLYLLDAEAGMILRGLQSIKGYDIDTAFKCGPTAKDVSGLGKLVDMVPIPLGGKYTVQGVDANGTTLNCGVSGQPPVVERAAPPQGMKYSDLPAAAADGGSLYLLDPGNKGVWFYGPNQLKEQPALFFGKSGPSLDGVKDLGVNGEELYLLRSDGKMTICFYSGLNAAPTRCADPVAYMDDRPGREKQPLTPPNPFTRLLVSAPPDPSIYLMDPRSQTVYRFSLRSLTFQRAYLPALRLPDRDATAFYVSPTDRTIFLALGDEVYKAQIP